MDTVLGGHPLLSRQLLKSPNLFPLFTLNSIQFNSIFICHIYKILQCKVGITRLNETFIMEADTSIKWTRTPKKYLKWQFLLLPTCTKRTLVIKFNHRTCQTPEMRKIALNCHPQIFRFLH